MRFIAQDQERGFTLEEIRAALALHDWGRTPCASVARVVGEKIAALDEEIARLQARRAQLAESLRLWECGSLPASSYCPIIGEIRTIQEVERMARQVEVFTAGCPLCDETVKLVQSLACGNCEVTVYDLREGCETNECRDKTKQYGIHRVPAVVIDGKLADCCNVGPDSADALKAAGLGAG